MWAAGARDARAAPWPTTPKLLYRAESTPMPLQNRVTPFGDVVAIAQRGLFTGNRGIIHDPATKTLLRKRWATNAWLICLCEYKGRRREVMDGRSWTELFFLDQAVALAAGHRPCFFCRRQSAEAFRAAWTKSRGGKMAFAPEIDAVLHEERLDRGRKRLHAVPGDARELPDGAMIAVAGEAYTIARAGRSAGASTAMREYGKSLAPTAC
jgi:hypothetical protein